MGCSNWLFCSQQQRLHLFRSFRINNAYTITYKQFWVEVFSIYFNMQNHAMCTASIFPFEHVSILAVFWISQSRCFEDCLLNKGNNCCGICCFFTNCDGYCFSRCLLSDFISKVMIGMDVDVYICFHISLAEVFDRSNWIAVFVIYL
ncbi:hypothetical protein D9M71_564180 [compost metagenome]